MAALLRIIRRHPVVAFMVIGLGAYFLTATIRPIADADILPFDLPLHGVLGGVLGVGVGAFVVTGALAGRDGVVDLARRSLRWRVPARWYAISLLTPLLILSIALTILYSLAPLRALAQNWLLLFTAFLPALAIMIVLNNVAEEIGWTGFVFARFQDRHGPLRAALSAHCGGRAGGHGRTRLCPID